MKNIQKSLTALIALIVISSSAMAQVGGPRPERDRSWQIPDAQGSAAFASGESYTGAEGPRPDGNRAAPRVGGEQGNDCRKCDGVSKAKPAAEVAAQCQIGSMKDCTACGHKAKSIQRGPRPENTQRVSSAGVNASTCTHLAQAPVPSGAHANHH